MSKNLCVMLCILLCSLILLFLSYRKWSYLLFTACLLCLMITFLYYSTPEYHYNVQTHQAYRYNRLTKRETKLKLVGFKLSKHEDTDIKIRALDKQNAKFCLFEPDSFQDSITKKHDIQIEDVVFDISSVVLLENKNQCVIAGNPYYIVDDSPTAIVVSIPLPGNKAVNIQISKESVKPAPKVL